MSIINVAIVGLGIGKSHLEAYMALPELYRVVALCDLNLARSAAAARPYGPISLEKDFDVLLQRKDVDLVDICTPPNQHLPMIAKALAVGKHVVCEKPLVGSLADCDALIALTQKAKGKLVPIFQYRWGNGLQKLKLLVDRGITGPLYLSTIETSWRRDADYYATPWRGKYATEMGGVLLTQAIHSHDILNYLAGPTASVYARANTSVNPIEVEDCAVATLQMADGSLANLSATLGSAVELSRLRFTFKNLTAESRSPEPYRPGKEPWIIEGKNAEVEAAIARTLADFKPGLESFEGQFAATHAVLNGHGEPPVALADARRSLELITALYHSAETGEVVKLPIGPGHPKYRNWVPAKRFSRII